MKQRKCNEELLNLLGKSMQVKESLEQQSSFSQEAMFQQANKQPVRKKCVLEQQQMERFDASCEPKVQSIQTKLNGMEKSVKSLMKRVSRSQQQVGDANDQLNELESKLAELTNRLYQQPAGGQQINTFNFTEQTYSIIAEFFTAIHNNDLTTVRLYLSLGLVQINVKDQSPPYLEQLWRFDGSPALMVAAAHGYTAMLRMLVKEFKANVEDTDNDGGTALMAAVSFGQSEAARILLGELGANVNAASNDGSTALMHAASSSRPDLVRKLVKEFGAQVEAKCTSGETSLMAAVVSKSQKSIQVVVHLLVEELGAQVDAANNDGYTALMFASIYGKYELVDFLIKNNANTQARTRQGKTALDLAGSAPGVSNTAKQCVVELLQQNNRWHTYGISIVRSRTA